MEIWKDIQGYEGFYKVSTHGNVRSVERLVKVGCSERINKGRLMALTCDTDGYFQLHLSKNSIVKVYKVHRLVAETFIPNPENKPLPNHKNGLKQINHYKNLEWVTHAENSQHAYDTGLHVALTGEAHQNSKRKDTDILEIRRLHSEYGYTYHKISKMVGIHQSIIGKIIKRQIWKHI